MDDLKKYKEDILRLKSYFWRKWLIELSDKKALEIIKETNKKAKERVKNGK